MKKLTLLLTVLLSSAANAGFLDGVSKVLGATGNILNTVTGTPNNTQGNSNSSGQLSSLPVIKKYTVPNKETSQYKIEDLTFTIEEAGTQQWVHTTGKLYNKTNRYLTILISVPQKDKEGFSRAAIGLSPSVEANGKSRIEQLDPWSNDGYEIDIDKIKYSIAPF